MNYTDKQREAIRLLSPRSEIQQLLYGGSAGSGKTMLGCDWQIKRRLKYAGTRGLIGRAVLKKLRLTTLKTFWECTESLGLQAERDFTYNGSDQIFRFYNGSEIILMDLADSPRDPEFQTLGGLELTDYFIDEAGEVSSRCIDILDSRTRFMLTKFCKYCAVKGLDEGLVTSVDDTGKAIEWKCSNCGESNNGLIPKGLMSCNPNKGWLYSDFFDAQRKGTLRSDRYFLQALPTDNPHLPAAYIEKLRQLPEIDRKRLLEGNWDYDETKDRLYDYDDLLRCFRDLPENTAQGTMYITADIARGGRDRTVIILWNALCVVKITILTQSRIDETAKVIGDMANQYGVKLGNVIVDEDGVGGGCKDMLRCKGFVNGSRAVRDNYSNLKADCYFKLAELITNNKLIFGSSNKYKQDIIKELEMIRRSDIDTDKKLSVTPKKMLPYSPDIADAVMMRAYFELVPNYGVYSYI